MLLTVEQEKAFGRIVKANALPELLSVVQAQVTLAKEQYTRAANMVIETGNDRAVALKLLGRISAFTELIEMMERQRT